MTPTDPGPADPCGADSAADADPCRRLFWAWLATRSAAWVAVAILTQPNAPLDLVEWLSWGHQFAWGYPKHPPLPGWVAAAAARLSPGDVWGVYLAGYACTAACLWAAWQVGREFLSPRLALAAAVCLDGLSFFTGDSAEFSNNVVLNAAWALTVLFYLRAIRAGRWRWWVALGLTVGVGLLSKYTLGVLLLALAGYTFVDARARRHLRHAGPYLAAFIALVVVAPHAAWLVRNDFITVRYAGVRSAAAGWASHVTNPASFLYGQGVRLLPVVLALNPLLSLRPRRQPASTDATILYWAGVGPVALLFALSAVTGCQLRDIWGSSLWTFTGVWLLAVFGTASDARLRRAVRTWAVTAGLMLAIWAGHTVMQPYARGRPTRVHYPGRVLATEIGRRWSDRCAVPFPIVAGEAWRAGNVCCYSPHRPVIYSSGAMGYLVFEPEATPWTGDADMTARGGVLVWDAAQLGDSLPPVIRARFPGAEDQPPIVLPYQTGAAIRPDRVGVSFVWPSGSVRSGHAAAR